MHLLPKIDGCSRARSNQGNGPTLNQLSYFFTDSLLKDMGFSLAQIIQAPSIIKFICNLTD